MSKNNHVELTGNMGSKARMLEQMEKVYYGSFSLATQDSYKDKEDKWVERSHSKQCFML